MPPLYRERTEGTTLRLEYASWADFVTDAETLPLAPYAKNTRARENVRDAFCQSTWQQCCQWAREGWPEGLRHAAAIKDALWDAISSHVAFPVLRYDVEGAILDIGRLCGGEPEHWGTLETELREMDGTRFLHLVINGCASAGIPAETLQAKAGTLGALVELLEYAGLRVKVTLAIVAGHCTTTVPVKEYSDWLDTDRLTFMCGHPSVLRRLMFAIWCSFPRATADQFGFAYPIHGHVGEMPAGERGDIYVGGGHFGGGPTDWRDPAQAHAWVLQTLRAQGVHVREGEGA
jgi:hypothetical protein